MMQPIGDRVLVRPIVPEEKVGGIFVIRDETSSITRGTVLAAGPEVSSPLGGAVIYYSEYAGENIEIAGEKLLVLRESDVFGVEA